MFRPRHSLVAKCFFLWLLFSLVANFTWAQSETATVSGQVVDPSGLNITGAQVKLVDIDRDTSTSATTSSSGLYTFQSVRPGRYRMAVTAAGFKVVNVTGVTVNVQDHLEQNFKLVVGSVSESITVEGGAPLVDTESAAVSTMVDRQFAENLPLNGRSFQTLIELTPGVVLTPSSSLDSGQFSVNGQRPSSNYWMLDGVSANIGVGVSSLLTPGNGFAGALGSFSALGGTNSLVSVDAMQEFRIQTSTYAPEFGRTPGGQISIVTRSGTNQFHGTAFDYLRNDAFDANDWFNGDINNPPLPKAKERQNDFGGTFSGPILKDRTFLFFSYEGLRLRLPQTALTTVPDLGARQSAAPAMEPFLDAYPRPNGADLGNGSASFNASYSNSATLDAYSVRIDDRFNDKLTFFGRYNYSPSEIVQRGGVGISLSTVSPSRITTQTATVGATWIASPTIANDLRFNYSRTNANNKFYLDNFGGAIPPVSLPFPSPYSNQNGIFDLNIFSLAQGILGEGKGTQNLQRQTNVVDNLSVQKGSHALKFGVDYRRLTPLSDPNLYNQNVSFINVTSAETGSLFLSSLTASRAVTILFRNFGAFAQDTWRILPRLTLTYGLRWDVDLAPSSISGPNLLAVSGFNLNDLSQLAIAPVGTPPFKTPYGNVAPRLGFAYQVIQNQDLGTVFRGGFGVFYDLATSEVGNTILGSYPFQVFATAFGGTFPLGSPVPPPFSPSGQIAALDPHLQLPYTLQWNVGLEQALGRHQTISASYIGSAGRRLIQSAYIFSPNPSFNQADLVGNTAISNYNALQVQFQRRLTRGLQVLASYTWSHSIDDGSAGSIGNAANTVGPAVDPTANRGPSDFDIRNAVSAAATYEIPAPKIDGVAHKILAGWSIQNVIQARSAPPVNVDDGAFVGLLGSSLADVRPDLVPGIPVYLTGRQYPGGKIFNNTPNEGGSGCVGPFCPPPTNPNTGALLRQGNLQRNALRGFGASQWDFAIHREFPLHDLLRMQFRAEMFNILNHPNFGQASGDISSPQFGRSTQMLGQTLSGGNVGGGGLSALYQIGGPRSIQFALKLEF